MKISIKYKPKCEDRPWLVVRVGGKYEQHAHLKTKGDGSLIDAGKYPYCKDYKVAMMRLLTEEEFKKLDKKQRYFNKRKV